MKTMMPMTIIPVRAPKAVKGACLLSSLAICFSELNLFALSFVFLTPRVAEDGLLARADLWVSVGPTDGVDEIP